MVLSQRERYIAIGLGAIVLLGALYVIVIGPYFERRGEIATGLTDADAELEKGARTFREQETMRKIMKEMRAGGLGTSTSEAESQVQNNLDEWAQECGVNVQSLNFERPTPEGKFLKVGFHMTGIGPLSTLSNLLWRIENTTMPLRVDDIQIVSRKEGQDDLQFRLGVSTICENPGADKSLRSGATADARGGM